MKLPSFVTDFENHWIALSKKPYEIVSSARTYKSLARKLTKKQKERVVVLKIPKFDQFRP